MKWFTFLYALYILALSLAPCTDAYEHRRCTDHPVAAQSADHGHDHDHGDDTSDTCTPFCMCSCCHTSMTAFTIPASDIPVIRYQEPEDEVSTYQFSFSSAYYGNIWQPPKA